MTSVQYCTRRPLLSILSERRGLRKPLLGFFFFAFKWGCMGAFVFVLVLRPLQSDCSSTGGASAWWWGGGVDLPASRDPSRLQRSRSSSTTTRGWRRKARQGFLQKVFNGNFPDREPWDACGVMDKRCIVVASG
ncbi:unnamed protein product [Gadus morhua 'NCC']